MHILIVEDQPDSLDVLRRLLSRLGHQATGATSLAEARAACDTSHFDLMICDVGLPDGSGLELGEVARQRGIKAIVMSGLGMEDLPGQGEVAGFADHLIKPFKLEQLQRSIDRIIPIGDPRRSE